MMRSEYPNQDHAQQPAAPDDKLTPGHASEAEDLEDLTTIDEPLFWPFEQKADWNSEANWNYFAMSPRKGISITASETPPDSIPLEHHDRNMDVEQGQGVRLVFSSGSAASKNMKLKQKYKSVRRTNTLPSRLSRATKSCEKIYLWTPNIML